MSEPDNPPARAGGQRIDAATGVETVGHEWDGIEELNNPLPRWWLFTFYATILFAIGYMVLYPAIPLLDRGTEGIWGWTSRGQLAAEAAEARQKHAADVARLSAMPTEDLQSDPRLLAVAIAGGKAAFRVNCVQCHGSEAGGIAGHYPNLSDDDWLWGGNIKEIEQTITNGIRFPGNAKTRSSLMPSFGRDKLLTPDEISDLTSYVRTLSGKERPSAASARGAPLFASNCASCHGPDGKGMRQFGAPNLTDAIWLYGGSRAAITETLTNARAGVMPAWTGRLDPVTIKMLAAYVHSLGGGEDFGPPAAETPTATVNAQR